MPAVLQPELDQLGAAGLGAVVGRQAVDGPVVDGELVEAELDVPLDRLVGGLGPVGLEVDDHDAAVGVELEPVGVAGQAHLLAALELDHRRELLLGAGRRRRTSR